MKRFLSRGCVLLLLMLMIFAGMPERANAAESSESCSLSVNPDRDVILSVYKVADAGADGTYTLADSLAGNPAIDIDAIPGADAEEIRKIAATVDLALTASDTPIAAQISAKTGKVTELAAKLGRGIYLIRGTTADGKAKVVPFLLDLPRQDAAGEWVSDWTITELKYETRQTAAKLRVMKTWSGDHQASRPRKVEIAIEKDADNGSVLVPGRTVILSADNNWTYDWTDEAPEEAGNWKVSEVRISSGENVNADYSVLVTPQVSEDGEEKMIVFRVNNTKPGNSHPPRGHETHEHTHESGSAHPSQPETASSEGTTASETDSAEGTMEALIPSDDHPERPQPPIRRIFTGDTTNLWIPILGMAISGMLLILLGIRLHSRSDKHS